MRPINLGLFVVERETDIIAFVAFLISIFNLGVAGWWLLRGPQPKLLPVTSVTLSAYRYNSAADEPRYLRLAADMVYANEGPEGQSVILKRETVKITAPDTPGLFDSPVELIWSKFEERTTQGDVKYRENVRNAFPVTVLGKGVVAHHTYFAPHAVDCNRVKSKGTKADCDRAANFVKLDPLLEKMRAALPTSSCYATETCIRLALTFVAEFFGHDTLELHCDVYLGKKHLENLADNKRILRLASQPDPDAETTLQYGWTTRDCHLANPTKTGSASDGITYSLTY